MISNRRARYDYVLGDSFVVGIALTGAETKSLRMGHGHLRGSYAAMINDELWLINATITGGRGVIIDEQDQNRSRKLLAKRRELDAMQAAKQQGMTLVPTGLLIGGRYIKLKLSLGRGKKLYDKRQVIKKREFERENSK